MAAKMEAIRIVRKHWLLAGTFVCFFWPALLIFSPLYIPPLLLYSLYTNSKAGKTNPGNQITGSEHSRGADQITTKKSAAAPNIGILSEVHGSVHPSANAESIRTEEEALMKDLSTPQETGLEEGTVVASATVGSVNQEMSEALKGTALDPVVETTNSEDGQINKIAATESVQLATPQQAVTVAIMTPVQNAVVDTPLESAAKPSNEKQLSGAPSVGTPLDRNKSPETKETEDPITSSPGAPETPAVSKKPLEGPKSAVVKDHAGEVKQSSGLKQVGHARHVPVSTEDEPFCGPAKTSSTALALDPAQSHPSSAPASLLSSSKEGKANPTGGSELKADHKPKSKKKKKSHVSK